MYLLSAYQGKGDKNWVAKIKDDFQYEFLSSEWTKDKYFIGWRKDLFEENAFYAFHTEKKTSYFRVELDENNQNMNLIHMKRFEVEAMLSELNDPFCEVKMQSVEFLKRSMGPTGVIWLKWCEAPSMEEIQIYENQTHYKIEGMIDESTEQYTRNFQRKKDFGMKSVPMQVLLHKQRSQYRLCDVDGRWIINSLADILENS